MVCNSTGFGRDTEHRIAQLVCALAISVLGIAGNLIALILLLKVRISRNPTFLLVANLCAANLISATFTLPFVAAHAFRDRPLGGEAFCQTLGYVMFVGVSTNCMAIVCITLNQYAVIVHQVHLRTCIQRYRHLHQTLSLGLPWLLSASIFLIPLTETWDSFGWDARKGYCTLINAERRGGFQYTVSLFVAVMMTVIIFYCYPAIYWVHRRSQRRVHASPAPSTANMPRSIQRAAVKFRTRAHTRNMRVIRMLVAVTANYCVTFLPFFLLSAADPCLVHSSLGLQSALINLSWSQVVTNPIIFALHHTQLRAHWRQLVAASCCKSETQAEKEEEEGQAVHRGEWKMKVEAEEKKKEGKVVAEEKKNRGVADKRKRVRNRSSKGGEEE